MVCAPSELPGALRAEVFPSGGRRVVGCILIFFMLAHSVDILFNPSLLDLTFYSFIRWLSLRFSLRLTFPDGVFLKNTVWFISCDQKFCYTEHFRLFSFPVPRNIIRNLRLLFFPTFNSTF
jgi:hypothetical protein